MQCKLKTTTTTTATTTTTKQKQKTKKKTFYTIALLAKESEIYISMIII